MRGLARNHEVDVLSFTDPSADDGAAASEMRAYCGRLILIPNERYAASPQRKRLAQIRSLVSARSYEHALYRDSEFQRTLQDAVRSQAYDVVNVEFMHMAANLPAAEPRRARRPLLVLDEHNVEYDIVRRTALTTTRLDRKAYCLVNWRKVRAEEIAAWRRFDGCTVTSERDEAMLRRDVPDAATAVVPNAVDIDAFRPRPDCDSAEDRTLTFFGVPSYHPNHDGLLFFIRDVLPRVRTRYPGTRLRIIGPSVPPEIAAYASEEIEVVGLVDDVRPHLERATAVIVPLRIGGGTRFKILEAMAMGKAVVSTRIGAEGIDVADGSNILLGDSPEAFAAAVGRLFDDPSLRTRMGIAARSLIERRYSWAHSVARLEDFYGRLLHSRERAA